MGELLFTEVELEGFRNHERWTTVVGPGLTVLVGSNAAGKTNVLEAIAVAVSGRSFRPYSWPDLVREGEPAARVFIKGVREGVPFTVTLSLTREGTREHKLDGQVTQAALLGRRVPTVSFVPEDLSLSKGTAEERRGALDRIGERLSAGYARVKREYGRVLKQRNSLLRRGGPLSHLDPWNERLSAVGAALVIQRARLLVRMGPELQKAQGVLGGGERLEMSVSASWSERPMDAGEVVSLGRDGVASAIRMTIDKESEEERRRGFSLVGPHKDDVMFLLEERDARTFSSQGQHRTLALAWKAAEVGVVRHVTGYQPVLLLDDVMSELDEDRRQALSREVMGKAQAIVTTTNLDYFTEEILSTAVVARV